MAAGVLPAGPGGGGAGGEELEEEMVGAQNDAASRKEEEKLNFLCRLHSIRRDFYTANWQHAPD